MVDGSLESPWSTFYSLYLNLFAIYYSSGVIRQNVYSSAVFVGGRVDLFALKFYLDKVVASNHSWYHKTRDTGLSDGKDRIPVRSRVLTQYRSVTDRQTDAQTDGFAVAYTEL